MGRGVLDSDTLQGEGRPHRRNDPYLPRVGVTKDGSVSGNSYTLNVLHGVPFLTDRVQY